MHEPALSRKSKNAMNNEQQPVALITGAAQRIGRAMAFELHRKGFKIIVHCQRSLEQATTLADELNAHSENTACIVQADLSDANAVVTLAQSALEAWNRIDVLINNASEFLPDKNYEQTIQAWQNVQQINAGSAWQLSKALAPELAQRQGKIINLIDIYADRPLRNHTLYCASKASSAMLVKSLALELAPDIRVNGIAPGAILWPENQNDPAVETSEYQRELLSRIPLSRLGDVSDICKTMHFIIECDYLNGQIIAVDGGRSLTI
jgi:pteridine reductase